MFFDKNNFVQLEESLDSKKLLYKKYSDILYVDNPVDALFQSLDLYEPISFENKIFDKLNEAPIIFLNRCGGYMSYSNSGPRRKPPHERKPAIIHSDDPQIGPAPGVEGGLIPDRQAMVYKYLAAGFVVVVVSNRGRDYKSKDGKYLGKSPAMIVDLKAAIRFLRVNKKEIPGNTELIISRGSSAGGGLSALLACSGNDPDYEPYLDELSAAKERDDIFAAICMSPVLDLEHQNSGYEWQYGHLPVNGFINDIKPPVEQNISMVLADEFEEYFNKLGLITRDNRNLNTYNYKDYYLKEFLLPAASSALNAMNEETRIIYLKDRKWIKYNLGKAEFTFEDYEKYLGRLKGIASFDSFKLGESENTAFGKEEEQAAYYTDFVLQFVTGNRSAKISNYINTQKSLLNPMIRIRNKKGNISKYWWFRMGTKESGFACPITVAMATTVENMGKEVDFKLVWDGGHCAETDNDSQIEWIYKITGYSI